MSVPMLPLPAAELPEGLRRFGDPKAPTPAKTMAAKGLVPVKGGDLVTLLVQLGADQDGTVKQAARDTLNGLPDGVLLSACDAALHPAILDGLAGHFPSRDAVLEKLVMNQATSDFTVERIARSCSESIAEAIAINQQRILAEPKIIEALYKNEKTRMSTADRLVELCARNGVVLEGIPAFADHVEAIKGQLIPEPDDEPLPDDMLFSEALATDADTEPTGDDDEEDEAKKKKSLPLRKQIESMTKAQKIRLAQIGGAAARSILVRDPQKSVAEAAVRSPRMTAAEAAEMAHSKEIGERILNLIAKNKKWVSAYEVKRGLVFNSKTPIAVSLKFLSHMRDHDLKKLSKSRNVAGPIKNAASQRLEKKQKGGRG